MDPLLLELPENIETPRVVLRPLVQADAEAVFEAVAESTEILQRQFSGKIAKKDVTLEDIKSYIQEQTFKWHERSYINFGVFTKGDGTYLGNNSLHTYDWTVPRGRMGYWLRNSETGKGYATEAANATTRYAFEVLKLKRFDIWCNNKVAAQIPERLGYPFIGHVPFDMTGDYGQIYHLDFYLRTNMDDLPDVEVAWF